jgi:hypothetical protein
VTSGAQSGEYDGNWQYFATIGTYLKGQTGPFVPLQAHPTGVSQCSTNGAGCATSNCNAGSSCSGGGSLSTFSGGKTTTDKTLTVAIAAPGGAGGSVSGTGGISCPGTCSRTFTSGTAVGLTAVAAPGSVFTGWNGGGCSGTSSCTVTMNADQTVTAVFAVKQTPPPTPAPTCRLSAKSASVLLRLPRNRRRLGPVGGSARAGVALPLALKLPRGALSALGRGVRESLAASVHATNGNGAANVRTSLTRLRGTR